MLKILSTSVTLAIIITTVYTNENVSKELPKLNKTMKNKLSNLRKNVIDEPKLNKNVTTEVSNLSQSAEVSNLSQNTEEVSNLSQNAEVSNLSQSTEEVSNLSQSTNEVSNLSQSTNEVSNLSQNTNEASNLSQSTEEVSNLSQSTDEVSNLNQSTNEVSNLNQSTNEVSNLSQSTEEVSNLSQSAKVSNLSQSTNEVSNLNQSTEVSNLSQSTEEVSNLSQSTEEVSNLSQSTEVSNLSQSTNEVSNLSQSTEVSNLSQSTKESNLSQSTEDVSNLSQSTNEVSNLIQSTEEVSNLSQSTTEVSKFRRRTTEKLKLSQITSTEIQNSNRSLTMEEAISNEDIKVNGDTIRVKLKTYYEPETLEVWKMYLREKQNRFKEKLRRTTAMGNDDAVTESYSPSSVPEDSNQNNTAREDESNSIEIKNDISEESSLNEDDIMKLAELLNRSVSSVNATLNVSRRQKQKLTKQGKVLLKMQEFAGKDRLKFERYREPYWKSGEYVFLRTGSPTTPKNETVRLKPGETTTAQNPMEIYRDCDRVCSHYYRVYGKICAHRLKTRGWINEYKNFDNICDMDHDNCVDPNARPHWHPVYKGVCAELTTFEPAPYAEATIVLNVKTWDPYVYVPPTPTDPTADPLDEELKQLLAETGPPKPGGPKY